MSESNEKSSFSLNFPLYFLTFLLIVGKLARWFEISWFWALSPVFAIVVILSLWMLFFAIVLLPLFLFAHGVSLNHYLSGKPIAMYTKNGKLSYRIRKKPGSLWWEKCD